MGTGTSQRLYSFAATFAGGGSSLCEGWGIVLKLCWTLRADLGLIQLFRIANIFDVHTWSGGKLRPSIHHEDPGGWYLIGNHSREGRAYRSTTYHQHIYVGCKLLL